jgi:hypothetical protein
LEPVSAFSLEQEGETLTQRSVSTSVRASLGFGEMITQRNELILALEADGWAVRSVDETPSEWWIDTVILLESVWSPVGTQVHLLFLVDPQHDGHRPGRKHVWAAAASIERPRDRAALQGPTLGMHGWRAGLKGFVQSINDLRSVERR